MNDSTMMPNTTPQDIIMRFLLMASGRHYIAISTCAHTIMLNADLMYAILFPLGQGRPFITDIATRQVRHTYAPIAFQAGALHKCQYRQPPRKMPEIAQIEKLHQLATGRYRHEKLQLLRHILLYYIHIHTLYDGLLLFLFICYYSHGVLQPNAMPRASFHAAILMRALPLPRARRLYYS